ncbi:MAG: hypothetical protein RI996_173 [Candidatus Parcubacteria bacterium]
MQKIAASEYLKYVPSKKTALFIGGVLATLFLFFIIINSNGVSYNTSRFDVVTVNGVLQQDTDADGITDWEERLWGTDPKDSDSDNDGIPDGAEISQERDLLAIANGTDGKEITLSETDKFARGIFATYSALSEKGVVSDTAASALAASALTKMTEQVPTIQRVYAADLRIVAFTQASNETYKKNLITLSTKNPKLGTEFELVFRGVAENNGDLLRDSQKYAKYYADFKIDLLKMSVPTNQVQNHMRLIDNISSIAMSLPRIDSIQEDIVLGIPFYTMYTESYQDMILTFDAIATQE